MRNKESKYALFGCVNPRRAFQSVVLKLGEVDEETATLTCTQGHRLSGKILKTFAGALFNAFTSNYARDISSQIHRKRKQGVSKGGTRSQSSAKKRKLTGEK